MARYRYLNRSELVAVRRPASEALRWRRPRRAARARLYVTHPGRDMVPLALVVRQWISRNTPTPGAPSLPVPEQTDNTASTRPRVAEPRTSPDLRPKPSATPTAASLPAMNPVDVPVSVPLPAGESVPGSGFTAALASRPRIQALREGTRSRTRPGSPTAESRAGSPTAKSRAAARLRARTAAFRNTDHLIADRDGSWKDAMAAARILKWDLGRAA
ncbi:hypothetical protein PWG71_01835 [Nocardiopsis sp. N85]|uniref:hypothetical protein n=1 Tax=Nocardiopsis sp. N85 TaxID=3029400 RepID=UPI00237FA202|nr:hypothetical protein [Nocardiopsis sp. N85]MDE3720113.1 hypothetical protein [Nocardiopsis sp. N85]